jgi:uncharacterized membrane protein YgaE (UPF0421/DUF939 family)
MEALMTTSNNIPAGLHAEDALDIGNRKLSRADATYVSEMTVACLITYWIVTYVLHPVVEKPDQLLGGMWAVVATVFVFRTTDGGSVSAAISRMAATCVSFVLCLGYLLIFPFNPVGMAMLIGIGTVVMMLLRRRDDIITTGITTAVVMVVAALSPDHAWHQPILRFVDTLVGIAVGIGVIELVRVISSLGRTSTEPLTKNTGDTQ